MPIKLTTKQFIEKSLEIHKNKYDYSKVNYINSSTKVEIICAEHGSFYKTPNKHLASKQGCPNCSKNYKWSFNKVSVKLKNIYTNLKVIDFCNKSRKVLVEENGIQHEIFLQSALKGTKLSIQTALDKTKFIIPILTKLHNNKYSYENLIYKNSLEKVIITCKVHGDFSQSISDHKERKGCPKCAKENKSGWTYTDWVKSAKNSKNFDSFKVYIIKCWNENEEFYKIGKTFTTLKERLRKINYNYKIIKIYEGGARKMSILEKELHKLNKDFVYLPKIKFNGHKECFKKVKYE